MEVLHGPIFIILLLMNMEVLMRLVQDAVILLHGINTVILFLVPLKQPIPSLGGIKEEVQTQPMIIGE